MRVLASVYQQRPQHSYTSALIYVYYTEHTYCCVVKQCPTQMSNHLYKQTAYDVLVM
jgi:hypothetical protein